MDNQSPRSQGQFTAEEQDYWLAQRHYAEALRYHVRVCKELEQYARLGAALDEMIKNPDVPMPTVWRDKTIQLDNYCQVRLDKLAHEAINAGRDLQLAFEAIPDIPLTFTDGEGEQHE